MTHVIVIGHGGYGTAIKNNLAMLLGELEHFSYIDFNIGEGLEELNEKIENTIKDFKDEPMLMACDLAGGSPFRQACLLASEASNITVVAGLNTAGYSSIAYSSDMSPKELAEMAVEASKEALMIFSL